MDRKEIENILLEEAKKSLKTNDVPIGAVLVEKDKIISKGHNTREKENKITGHAEINAVEKACVLKKTWHLTDCTLYVTLEPCKMCQEVIKQARIKKVYYYAKQEKIVNTPDIDIERITDNEEYSNLIKSFFKNKRN